MYLASLPANMITGTLMELLGPKRLVTIILVPGAALWLLLAFPPSRALLYVARIGLGFLMGVANTGVQPLTAELCEPRIRGFVTGKS